MKHPASSGMLKKERHAYIIRQINLHNKVLSSDLGLQLQVSEDTIRRDLNELSDAGKMIKVHGGALSKSFHFPYEQNNVYAQESKKEIAKKAIKLISEGMTILTRGGTTMLEMARMVPDDLNVTFFTISPVVAMELSEKKSLTVNLIGGTYNKNVQVNLGAKTVSDLSEIGADLCFLGANGIDVQEGITDSDWEVLQVKKAMIRNSARIAVMCIGEKLDTIQKMKVCSMNSVDFLITDLPASADRLTPYLEQTTVI